MDLLSGLALLVMGGSLVDRIVCASQTAVLGSVGLREPGVGARVRGKSQKLSSVQHAVKDDPSRLSTRRRFSDYPSRNPPVSAPGTLVSGMPERSTVTAQQADLPAKAAATQEERPQSTATDAEAAKDERSKQQQAQRRFERFMCPISRDVMIDPVVASDSVTYCRFSAITAIERGSNMPGCALGTFRIVGEDQSSIKLRSGSCSKL